jgi:hypothetical protein
MRPHLTLPAVVAIVVGVLAVALSVGEGLGLLLAIVLVSPLVLLVVVDELRQSNSAVRQRGSAHDDDPGRDERDGKDLPLGIERLDLVEADRGQGDDGHIQGVQQAPALDQLVTDRAVDRQTH